MPFWMAATLTLIRHGHRRQLEARVLSVSLCCARSPAAGSPCAHPAGTAPLCGALPARRLRHGRRDEAHGCVAWLLVMMLLLVVVVVVMEGGRWRRRSRTRGRGNGRMLAVYARVAAHCGAWSGAWMVAW